MNETKAAPVLKVIEKCTPPGSTSDSLNDVEGNIIFDSSRETDSDSYSDAHRKLMDAYWALSASPEKKEQTVVQLFYNGILKEEKSWKKTLEEKASKSKKVSKGKKVSSASTTADMKAPAAKKKAAKEVDVATDDKMEVEVIPSADAKEPSKLAIRVEEAAHVDPGTITANPEQAPTAPEQAPTAIETIAEATPMDTDKGNCADGTDNTVPKKKKKGAAMKEKKNFVDSNGEEIKKNQSAYFHFTAAKRADVKAELEEAFSSNVAAGEEGIKPSVTVIAKKMGELWKSLSAEEKEQYKTMAAADKVRYETAMASNPENAKLQAALKGEKRKSSTSESAENATVDASVSKMNESAAVSEGDVDMPKAKKSKKRVLVDNEGNEIKCAQPAFFLFSNEKRSEVKEELEKELQELIAENTEMDTAGAKIRHGDVAKRISELWKGLNDEGKEKYESAALVDKKRFEDAVASNPANVWYAEESAKKAAEKSEKDAEKERKREERAQKAAEKKKAADEKASALAAKKAEEARKQPSILAAFGVKPAKKNDEGC